MATATFSDSSSSVNPSSAYEALQQRFSLVEEDNSRLRHQLSLLESALREAEPGQYLFGDDGALDGPYDDIEKAARNCVVDGMGCTIITVIRHIAPAEQEIHEEAGPDCSACPSFFKTAA